MRALGTTPEGGFSTRQRADTAFVVWHGVRSAFVLTGASKGEVDLSHCHVEVHAAGERAHGRACTAQLDDPTERLQAGELGHGGQGQRPAVDGLKQRERLGAAVQCDPRHEGESQDAQRGHFGGEEHCTPPAGRGEPRARLGGAPAAELGAAAVLIERQQAEPAERVPAPAVHVVAAGAALLWVWGAGGRPGVWEAEREEAHSEAGGGKTRQGDGVIRGIGGRRGLARAGRPRGAPSVR